MNTNVDGELARLVERIRHGRSTVIVGALPPLPPSIDVVRVRCDLPGTLRPLDRARERIEHRLGTDGRDAESRWSARRRALFDEPAPSPDEAFVAACNRLAAASHGAAVLVLDGIERADAESHRSLARLLRRQTLRLPLLLVVRSEPSGSFLEVMAALREEVRPRPQSGGALDVGPLDSDTVRTLRAAAVVGPAFEASTVARLLDAPLPRVLESLQAARDAGVPIEDRGDATFTMPEELATMLAGAMLPSLQAHWHARLAEMLEKPGPSSAAGRLGERLDAVAMMLRAGDTERAAGQLGEIVDAIGQLSSGPYRNALHGRALLERARLRWLGAGLDPSFTLGGALEEAFAARTALGDRAPAAIRTDVAATIAGIAYEIGDGASLERAEEALTDTIASLLRDGAASDAAMLLNDHAALHLRIGRGRKARELLMQSLDLLTVRVKEAPDDAAARADLADTHHLLAKLPLHASGGDAGASEIAAALEHARTAGEAYRALGMRRDLARVWEIAARLEAKLGHTDAARRGFDEAMHAADAVSDLTGLARITAGLAELLASTGKTRDALGLLASSIELNREKGSPVGLAFDERALEAIARSVHGATASEDGFAADLERTRKRLAAAIEEVSP